MPLRWRLEKDTKGWKTIYSSFWLKKGELKRETESVLVATQQVDSPKCRLCCIAVENVIYIISAFKMDCTERIQKASW